MENSDKEINQKQNKVEDLKDATKEKERCLRQSTLFENTKKYLNTGRQAVAYRSVTVMCIFSRNGSQMIMSAPLGKVVTAC